MAKRKPGKTISLAGRSRDRVKPGFEDATPERLRQARAGGAASVDGAGVRRIAEPLDVLRARNLLDRSDVTLNETLWRAGDRLRGHWHRAQLHGLSTLDPARPHVDGGGGGPDALNPTETALRHRRHYRRAADVIGPRLLPYVRAVVIEARTVASLRGEVGDTAHARTADALALERVREGLHRLCDLWSMRPNERPLPIGHWREAAETPAPDVRQTR